MKGRKPGGKMTCQGEGLCRMTTPVIILPIRHSAITCCKNRMGLIQVKGHSNSPSFYSVSGCNELDLIKVSI